MTPIAEALAMLVEGFRAKDLSEVTIKTYARALEEVPAILLRPMVDQRMLLCLRN